MLDQSPISYRWFLFLSGLFLVLTLVYCFFQFIAPNSARVVFCDVGQGDGIYIRTSSGTDMVIDAGPDTSMVSCLGKYMPFFDKTIEYAFLSHPQHDHYAGFLGILRNYRIEHFYHSSGDNSAISYIRLKKLLKDTSIRVHAIHAITTLQIDPTSSLTLLWPTREFVSNDLNDYSEVLIVTLDNHRYLFTGDSSPFVLSVLEDRYPTTFANIAVLKVPHHGSKNGLTSHFLKLVDPMLSVISVATKNRYDHPSSDVLDYFKALNKQYVTTAQQGDIVITTAQEGLVVYGQDGLIVKQLLRH